MYAECIIVAEIIMQVKGKLQQNVEAAMKRGMLFSDLAGRAGMFKFELWLV